MNIHSLAAHALFALVIGAAACADPLPQGAKPLSSKQISKIYSGNSAVWDKSMVFFAPDGTTTGVFGKPPSAIFSGTWEIVKNKICMVNTPTNIKSHKVDTRTYTDCWIYYVDGKTILTSYYNDFQEGKGPNEDYYDGEIGNLKRGDVVSQKYAKYSK